MAGLESFDSREASSLSILARSKILPKVADLVANGSVGEFEFVEHDEVEGL
jgi:hypothetical protein